MGQPFLLKTQPGVWLVTLLALTIIGLNVVDALATLVWIQHSVEQANPFMAYILQYDTSLIIALKTLGVTAAVAFLIYCAIKRYAIALYGLVLLMLVYLCPLAAHLFLYTHTSLF